MQVYVLHNCYVVWTLVMYGAVVNLGLKPKLQNAELGGGASIKLSARTRF